MNKIKYFLIPLLMGGIFSLNSCNCISGDGEIKTELRKLQEFDEVNILCSGEVFLSQTDEYSVQIKTDGNVLPLVETHIKRKKLTIDLSECVKDYEKLEIHLSSKFYKEINIKGSCSVECENQLSAEDMEIDCSGSGKVEFDLHVNDLETDLSGSGNANFRGVVNEHHLDISGSGSVNAKNLKSDRTDAKVSGSGNCKIYATEEMNAKVSGSGSLTYSGDPKSVSTDITGSGTIKSK